MKGERGEDAGLQLCTRSHPRTPQLRQTGWIKDASTYAHASKSTLKEDASSYACIQAAPLELLDHCPSLQLLQKPEWSGAPTLFLTWVMFEKHATHRFKLRVEKTHTAKKIEHSCLALAVQAHTAGPGLAADLQIFKQQRPPPHRLWRPQTGAQKRQETSDHIGAVPKSQQSWGTQYGCQSL